MKTYFKFLKILIVTLLFLFFMTLLATAQSDNRINRLSKETGLFVKTAMTDKEGNVYNEQIIFCGVELVTHFINKRHFIAHTSKFELDLDVKKRKIGNYNSWLAVDKDGRRYFITPFTDGQKVPGYGVFIQPIDKNYSPVYDLPVITIANFNLCQP